MSHVLEAASLTVEDGWRCGCLKEVLGVGAVYSKVVVQSGHWLVVLGLNSPCGMDAPRGSGLKAFLSFPDSRLGWLFIKLLRDDFVLVCKPAATTTDKRPRTADMVTID